MRTKRYFWLKRTTILFNLITIRSIYYFIENKRTNTSFPPSKIFNYFNKIFSQKESVVVI